MKLPVIAFGFAMVTSSVFAQGWGNPPPPPPYFGPPGYVPPNRGSYVIGRLPADTPVHAYPRLNNIPADQQAQWAAALGGVWGKVGLPALQNAFKNPMQMPEQQTAAPPKQSRKADGWDPDHDEDETDLNHPHIPCAWGNVENGTCH